MTKGHVAPCKYYKTKGKAGYRMYHGRKYLGYSSSKPDATCKPKPLAERMRESKKTLALKVYKHVITRQTKKGPRYHGHILGPEEDEEPDMLDQEILPSGQVPEGGSCKGSGVLRDDTREHQSGEVFAGVASAVR